MSSSRWLRLRRSSLQWAAMRWERPCMHCVLRICGESICRGQTCLRRRSLRSGSGRSTRVSSYPVIQAEQTVRRPQRLQGAKVSTSTSKSRQQCRQLTRRPPPAALHRGLRRGLWQQQAWPRHQQPQQRRQRQLRQHRKVLVQGARGLRLSQNAETMSRSGGSTNVPQTG